MIHTKRLRYDKFQLIVLLSKIITQKRLKIEEIILVTLLVKEM